MANTIDVEAKRLIKHVADVDRHRRRYVLKQGNIRIQFVSPEIFSFEKYRFFLLRNSQVKKLEQRYHFRPDYLSFDEYGTTLLWPLLLYINDIPTIEEFVLDQLLIPDFASILEISKFDESILDPLDINELNATPTNERQLCLFASKVKPVLQTQTKVATTSEEEQVSYIRQKFTLTSVNILNKFVDLGFIPIRESIDLKIGGSGSGLIPIYDFHYTIVDNSSGDARRLSWSDSDNSDGDGLESVLVEGSRLEVQYSKA